MTHRTHARSDLIRPRRVAVVMAVFAATAALLAGAGTVHAAAVERLRLGAATWIAPGVEYESFSITTTRDVAYGHLLTADLSNRHVSVDLLTPGAVTAREPLSEMADAQGAVAGVNGDFFDITEAQHADVAATGAADGPAIGHGVQLKAAVPDGQRFGPAMPPSDSAQDVIAVAYDGVARLDRLALAGSASWPGGSVPLGGFNQYALPVGSVGAYTSQWGQVSRERAVCGTDIDRAAPCTSDAYEVTLRQGRVRAVSAQPGAGPIAPGTVVLLGRESGAQVLRRLRVGEPVRVGAHLMASDHVPLRFAVGGFPILRGGTPLAGLDDTAAATRTAAGYGNGGRRLYLLALDGSAESGAGLTVAELADVMHGLGAVAAVNLDGGGSTTLVARPPGSSRVTVRNHPTGGAERPVPEGIGIFSGVAEGR
ncbi:phosphodiester glycosidase family protein [Streptomyces sp. RB6PN25]|uniref:Phosphodiester glycosidase family protein n=1 Tax=Streptomyces humicola TaxID=2953240 RepID=A0ABT1PN84_9ACTN|nr:phosphodiester glycosidase family protein [Streptomyces humicola]MCQ4079137.1 phosphodiester glycosidase family protein [Streptomyces humicola]